MKKLLAILLFLLVATPAHAAPPCGPRVDIIKTLAKKYREAPKFIAIAGGKNLVEIFISKAGTWTVLITSPQGLTCIGAAGDSWEALPPVIIFEGPET